MGVSPVCAPSKTCESWPGPPLLLFGLCHPFQGQSSKFTPGLLAEWMWEG